MLLSVKYFAIKLRFYLWYLHYRPFS